METTFQSVLKSLIEAVEGDNGSLFLDGGLVHATIDPLDLGTAYVQACEALGRTPKLMPAQDEPVTSPALPTAPDSYRVAYAYSPRENVGSTGKYHLITTEQISRHPLFRRPGDALCKPARKFWGLDGGRTAEDFERHGCARCREIRDRLKRSTPCPAL